MSGIYTNTPYTNVPRDPSYPYGYPHLRGTLPQTHYPYDAVYDAQYQRNVRHPKYRYYGNMEYPYWVQRHRMPKVFTEPKPRSYKWNGFKYQIPPYPNYVYFYNNPNECRDLCGLDVCNEYFRRKNNYLNCKRCQNVKFPGPMCWDPNKQRCITCPVRQALSRCEDNFGCGNPLGSPHDNVPPINPKYTGCQNCN